MTDKIKRGLAFLAISVAAVAATALAPTSASAAGEQYQWSSNAYQSINVTGGRDTAGNNVSASGTLQQTSGSGTSARTYAGAITFNCSAGPQTANVSLTVGGESYIDGKPNTPTTAQVASRNAACVTLDTSVVIGQVAGQNDTATQNSINSPATTASDEVECDQGSVSWMLCPFITNASGAISKVGTSIISPFLRVAPLERFNDDGSETSLYKAWDGFRNLAYGLFIIVFVVIIYATLTQQDVAFLDSYTIKKILPRLVIAAILVQASFAISGFFIDIGNVGGLGITQLLNSITNPSDPADIGNIITNLLGISTAMVVGFGVILGTASWLAVGPLLLSLLLSVLVVVLVLGLRYLLIAVLIVISPLAMLAWVLPNTRKWFGNWLELFLRLVLMYPVIIGIIALAGIGNSILPSPTDVADSELAGVITSIIRPIIVIAAFAVIPFTFKLAGRGINRAYSIFNGQAQRGRSMLKGSDYWDRGKKKRQELRNTAIGSVLNSKPIAGMAAKGRVGQLGAGFVGVATAAAMLGGPTNRQALDASNNKLKNNDRKALDDMAEANVTNLKSALGAYYETDPAKRKEKLRSLWQTAPGVAQISTTPMGRRAIINKLADMNATGNADINKAPEAKGTNNIFSASRNIQSEYSALMGELGKESGGKPFITSRITQSTDAYQIKDALGNDVFRTRQDGQVEKVTIKRAVGDLDRNAVATKLRGLTIGDMGKKFTDSNMQVMLDGHKPDASPVAQRVAHELGEHIRDDMPLDVIGATFDMRRRGVPDLKMRLMTSMAMRAERKTIITNADGTDNATGRKKYDAILTDLSNGRDRDLAKELAVQAGIAPYIAEGYSDKKLANIATDFMRGYIIDPSRAETDYYEDNLDSKKYSDYRRSTKDSDVNEND